jgi:hypothetical protein
VKSTFPFDEVFRTISFDEISYKWKTIGQFCDETATPFFESAQGNSFLNKSGRCGAK